MSTDYSPPPPRQLPPDRLEQRKRHLLNEIASDLRAFPFPTAAQTPRGRRLGRRTLLTAAAVIASAVGIAFALTHGGTQTASAADVRAKLAEGLKLGQNVSGAFSVRTQNAGPRPRGVPGCLNCTPLVPRPTTFVIGA